MINPEAADVDEQLENRIDHQWLLVCTGKTRPERISAWGELTRLVALRSPEKVSQMEDERGLS